MKELPKAYDPKNEDNIYKLWEESGFFNPDKLPGERPEYFSVAMPPPNVTGVLHLGHALENALMDAEIRYQRMQGKKALIVPGTDHAAVATQARVEKELVKQGIKNPRQELGREELLKRIRDYAENSKATILRQIKKLGTSCDWSRLAYTFDEQRSKAVNEIFVRMFKDGLIYRGYRVVNWSVKGQSTCSDDELVYVNQKTKFYTFKYSKDFPISVATTRPETKLGDTAVAVHPDDERYKKYIGQTLIVDVGAKKPLEIQIIADESVDPQLGTGAVGITPAHSMVDYEMYEKHHLRLIPVIDKYGRMTEEAGEKYKGLKAQQARELFVSWLKENDLLEKEEEIEHSVGTSDRFGDVVEVIPMEQWFVDVNKKIPKRNKSLKDLMREAVAIGHNGDPAKKINILPDRFNNQYFHWIENLRDWCISRQIWWGHRIPVWYCFECNKDKIKNNSDFFQDSEGDRSGTIHYGDEGGNYLPDFEQTKRLIEEGMQLNVSLLPIVSAERPKKCNNKNCACTQFIQDPDTLDTWFSSGAWTFSILGWPEQAEDLKKYHPTSWMQMGYEILFFWMARMILMTTYILGDIPFKEVYIHGILRDKQGRKFSKSLGNGIDPITIIDKYGADAMRLSVMAGISPGNDSRFYEEKLKGERNLVNKLWNISRFILMSQSPESEFNSEASELNSDSITLGDKWILSRFNNLIKDITDDFDNYRFSLSIDRLRDFTWTELADWCLEISKIKNQNSKILVYILENLLKLWHPFTPFVTEEIWSNLGKKDLIMIEKWPTADKSLIDEKAEKDFALIQKLIIAIRNARSENKIEPKVLVKAKVIIKDKDLVENQIDVIKKLARVESLEVFETGEIESGWIKVEGDGFIFGIKQ